MMLFADKPEPRHCRIPLFALLFTLLLAGPARSLAAEAEVIRDPRYGEVLFHFYQEKYFSALTRLMRARKYDPIEGHGDMPEILLGALYQSYGLHDEARRIFTELLKNDIDYETRDQAWYYLGKSWYQYGEYDKAAEALNKVTDTLPPLRNEERLNLLANVYQHLGQPEKAIAVLEDLDSDSVWKHYAGFNLGVALLRAGKAEEGQELLEEVGDTHGTDEEHAALKDRANLALGFSWIQQQDTDEAVKYLRRIRLHGPFSNKALLGLGWAYNLAGDHRRALSAWRELAKRDPIDPAVQEALLAIPYSTDTVGAPGRALSEYEQALDVYAREQKRLAAVIESVEGGEIERILRSKSRDLEIITPLEIRQAASARSLPYLSRLLAGYEFQTAYKNYRDLFYLRQVLRDWEAQLPALQTMLRERKQAWQKKLNRISTDPRLHQLNRHLRRQAQLEREFRRIRQREDSLALASEEELRQLALLRQIGDELRRLRAREDPDTDLREQQERYRLYRGILIWDIGTDYAPRLWRTEKQLKQLDAALTRTREARDSLTRSWKEGPRRFQGYAHQLKSRQRKIKHLKLRLDALLRAQARHLKKLALTELRQRQQQLKDYQIRAQYNISLLMDKLSSRMQPRSEGDTGASP